MPACYSRADRPHPTALFATTLLLGCYFLTFVGSKLNAVLQGAQDSPRWFALALYALVITSLARGRFVFRAAQFFALLFVLASLAGSLVSAARDIALAKWFWMALQVTVFVFLIPGVRAHFPWERIFRALDAIVLTLVSLALVGAPFSGAWVDTGRYLRLQGSLGINPNSIGLLCMLCLGLHIWRIGERPRAVQIGIVGGTLVCLLLTQSRTATCGAAAIVLHWAGTLLSSRYRRFSSVSSAASLLLILGAIVAPYVRPYVAGYYRSPDDPFSSRAKSWELALEDYNENPWLGSGYGASKLAQLLEIQGPRSVGAVVDGGGYHAVLGCVGLAGAIPLAALILALVSMIVRRERGSETKKLYGLQACSIIVGLLVGLVGEPWLLGPGSPIHLVFWMCVGALLYANRIRLRAR